MRRSRDRPTATTVRGGRGDTRGKSNFELISAEASQKKIMKRQQSLSRTDSKIALKSRVSFRRRPYIVFEKP